MHPTTVKTVLVFLPFLVGAGIIQLIEARSIENGRRAEEALHTAEVRIAKALAGDTDPANLIHACDGIEGVVCECDGDTITTTFFSDESQKKVYEKRVWQVNGRNLNFVGLAE